MNTRAAALAALLCLPAVWAQAHSVKTRTIEIVHPWTYGAETDGTVRVAFKIKNIGKRADKLLRADAAIAKSSTLTVKKAGEKGKSSLSIAPGSEQELTYSGRHIVLGGVTRKLGAYDTFPMTLVFERAGRIKVEVLVEERPEPAPTAAPGAK